MIADIGHQLPPPAGRAPDSPEPALPSPEQQQASHPKPPPAPPRARTRTMMWIGIGILILFIALLIFGIIPRILNRNALAADASKAQNTPPQVYVVRPSQPGTAPLSLAANTQAIQDAVIYARASGYIRKLYTDIGQHVKAGQLLADIEAPDLDQQLRQAQADLQQSIKNLDVQKANLEFARVTVERYQAADKENAVAKEDVDQRIAGYQSALSQVAAAEANVASNQHNVDRFQQLAGFEHVTAPFDGTVTQRNIDIGALITAGSPTNNNSVAPTNPTGSPSGLLEVAQLDMLRVFVNVPQAFAPNVKPGLKAKIAVRGQLMDPVDAAVARTADALDPATRTLLTEVDIPNTSHRMMPGMFVYVGFEIPPAGTRWRLPATAVTFDQRGTQVVIVGPDNKLVFRHVIMGRDFGSEVDVQSGLNGTEWVVKQPTVALNAGEEVRPIEEKPGAEPQQ